MQRYFIPKEHFLDTTVRVTGDDAHHLTHVMRARIGDRIICSDGSGREAIAQVTEMDKGMVVASIIEHVEPANEPRIDVWIAQSLPKGDKMDAVIQKCTEIGAARFIPFVSERTVVRYDAKKEEKRVERWHKIAKEAAEQAHRSRIPVVEAPFDWERLLHIASWADAAFILYEKENGLMFRDALRGLFDDAAPGGRTAKRNVLIVIGPEGGFSEREIKEAEEAGLKPVSLGKRILRTETAAMVGLTCILYEFGEMGG